MELEERREEMLKRQAEGLATPEETPALEQIRSTADKEVTIILAEANKKSQVLKGEGDGERNKIFAEAFGRDPDFFSFYRSMQSYEKSLVGKDTSLILSPDSDFFKFFGQSGGRKTRPANQ